MEEIDSDDEAPTLVEVQSQPNSAKEEETVNEIPANNELKEIPSASANTDSPVEVDAKQELPPCPVTILSGFLGSGKTTLVQYILKSPDHGKRIAVIENEFGEGLAIESLIARDGVNNGSLTDLIELPNGCICCTVKDSLVTTLETLLDKRNDLDYILIECSGMANPGPIASLFWLDDALESRLRLDGIVTLCDAANLERQLKETTEAAQQIAYADRILLNKIDLLQEPHEQQVEHLTRLIRGFHSTAPIRHTSHAALPDLNWILDASCFDGQKFQDEPSQNVEQPNTHEHDHDHDQDHDHDHNAGDCAQCQQQQEHTHTSEISTISLVQSGSVNRQLMDRWLASVLWPNQDAQDKVLTKWLKEQKEGAETDFQHGDTTPQTAIFRVKGILSVEHDTSDSPDYDARCTEADSLLDQRRFIVQGVHDLWEIHPATSQMWNEDEERCCKLVIIGRYLDRADLEQGFLACFVPT